MYLSDKQYLKLLKRARKRLDTVRKAEGEDCTITGMKSTDTNVGLCDDSLTTKKSAMWPDQFPQRQTMKYRRVHQKCPLDWRDLDEDPNGCFYTCLFFQKGLRDIDKIKERYDALIKIVEDK